MHIISIRYSSLPVLQTLGHEAPRAICTKSNRNQVSQDKSENAGQKERLGVLSWDRWRDSLQEHLSQWESSHFRDSLWLSETERFLRRSILDQAQQTTPPLWRLIAPLSSIPSLGELLSKLIMQKMLQKANICGTKIRLDEHRLKSKFFFTHNALVAYCLIWTRF